MAETTAIKYLDFSGGMNAGASGFMAKDNELLFCNNCFPYKKGVLEKVRGISDNLIDPGVLANISDGTFCHYYDNSFNSSGFLTVGRVNNTTGDYEFYKEDSGGDYEEIDMTTTLPSNTIVDSTDFLGRVYMSAYSQTRSDSEKLMFLEDEQIDEVVTAPTGRFVQAYRDRLYVLATDLEIDGVDEPQPTKVEYSSYPVAGEITWDATTNFFEVGYTDGDDIVGSAVIFDRLIIFKRRSMWMWDETNLSKISDVGCLHNRTIQVVGSKLYWHDGKSLYEWSGSEPINISERIRPILDAFIPSTSSNLIELVTQMFATRYNQEYRLQLGDITIDGELLRNCWICYDTEKDIFYTRTSHIEANAACTESTAEADRTYFTAAYGNVHKFFNRHDRLSTSGLYQDNSKDLDSFFVTKNLDFGAPEVRKFNSDVVFFAKNPQGLRVNVGLDGSDGYDGSHTAVLTKNISKENLADEANLFRFRFSEKSSSQPWQFHGFVIDTKIVED